MARTFTRNASFLRPIGKGSDDLVAVKLHNKAITVAEVLHKSNVINIEQLASIALPRKLDVQNLSRQQDMIGDVLRGLRSQIGFTMQDAGIVIPGGDGGITPVEPALYDGSRTRQRSRRSHILG